MKKKLFKGIALVSAMSAITVSQAFPGMAAYTLEMRKKALVSASVMDNFDVTITNTLITRGAFAKLLVKASSYRQSVADSSNVSVFPDVSADSEYAPYIRICAEQGWMNAYLGGNFKPQDPVKMNEANKALLTLLGYTQDEFSGNSVANRNAKATAIGLKENVNKGINENLTWEDSINLFYNLMTTNTAQYDGKTATSQTIYGTLLGFTLTDNGELNLLDTLEANLKGPYVLRSGKSLSSVIPFAESRSNCYLNGETSSAEEIEDEAQDDCPVVVYYNTATKCVYAYSVNGQNQDSSRNTSSLSVAYGKIINIYYGSTDIMKPTSVEIEGTNGGIYYINSDEIAYQFSLYGDYTYGKKVTVLYQYDQTEDKGYIVAVASGSSTPGTGLISEEYD